MGKYIGSIHKLCRREGMSLCDSAKCPVRGKRKYPPGQHGVRGYRSGGSVYNKQLRAKQRAKRFYGMLDQQFRRFFHLAKKMPGNTGDNLLKLLESRLDNVVYRLGLSETRRQARQVVNHKHILVNGQRVNIPSYLVKPSDVISLSRNALKSQFFEDRLYLMQKQERPDWLTWDQQNKVGKMVVEPDIVDLIKMLEPKLIVELFSK